MHARHVPLGHGQQGKGIALAQIVRGGEGQLLHIVQSADVLGAYVAQLGPVLGPARQGVGDGPAYAVELQGGQFVFAVMRNKTVFSDHDGTPQTWMVVI